MSNFSTINHSKNKVTLKRIKNWLLSILGLCVILLAISFTLVRVAIRSVPDYSIAIQQLVSKKMEITIDIKKMDAEIYWLVPRLNLIDVNVSDKTGEHHLMHLEKIDITLNWSETIRTFSPVVDDVILDGLKIQVGINKKSQLLIQHYVVKENISVSLNNAITDVLNDIGDEKKSTFKVKPVVRDNFNGLNFIILNSEILFYDERYDNRNKLLTKFDLRLKNDGVFHVFEVDAVLPKRYGKKVRVVIEAIGDLFNYKKLQGRTYLALDKVNVRSWLKDYWREFDVSLSAQVDGEIWLNWSKLSVINATSHINVSDLGVSYLDDSEHKWNVDTIGAQMQWKENKEGWQLNIRDLIIEGKGYQWSDPAAVVLKVNNDEQIVNLQADFLRIEGLLYLGGMVNHVTDLKLPGFSFLEKFKPSGELRNINITLPLLDPHEVEINTAFSQIGLKLLGKEKTEISHLNGSVKYVDNKTWLTLSSTNVDFKFKSLFRKTIHINELSGQLEMSHINHEWDISSNALKIKSPHLNAAARFVINIPDKGKKFLDLTVFAKDLQASSVKFFVPASVINANVVEWLDMALNEGELDNGKYQFYGFLSDMPFREGEGVSIAELAVTGLSINYLKDWPEVKDISAQIRFENNAMRAKMHAARVLDSKILNADVYIDDFEKPWLSMKGKVDAKLKDLKRFVKESELRENVTNYINNIDLKGRGVLDLDIGLPLYGKENVQVKGKLAVKNGGFRFNNTKNELTHLNGTIYFKGNEYVSKNLKAELLGDFPGHKLNINIKTNFKNKQPTYHVNMKGNVKASSLLNLVPDIQPSFEGSSYWNLSLDVFNKKSANEFIVKGVFLSDLKGVKISLPGPLAKAADTTKAIKVNIGIRSDLSAYYKFDLMKGEKVEINHTKNKALIVADTASIKGEINVDLTTDGDAPIKLNLEYFDLNKFFKLSDASALSSSDFKKNKENNSIGMLLSLPSKFMSPLDFPSIDFFARKMRYKKINYINSTLVTHKRKIGTVIDSFKLSDASHTITGKGSWFTNKRKHSTTKINVNIDVSDLGKVLENLDVTNGILGASGNIKLRWRWSDAPYKFDWKLLQGDGVIKLKNGTLKNLDAGAGRLLGVLSFRTLLSLDLGEQLKEGFKFDSAQGRFVFFNENITTKNFSIESKTADFEMKGYVSIANDMVDQIITVRPSVGETFSLGTAVIAGPAAGGVVYLLQKIFNTDRLSEYQYSMKGSMDDPLVELISAPLSEEEDEEDEDF